MNEDKKPQLIYGDPILITYRNNTNNKNNGKPKEFSTGIEPPKVMQDIGFFVQYENKHIVVARHNPKRIGNGEIDDLPDTNEILEFWVADRNCEVHSAREILLGATNYCLTDIMEIQKLHTRP